MQKKTSAGRKPAISPAFDECELQLIAKANQRLNGKVRENFDLFRKATQVKYLFEENFTKCVITTPKSVHVGVAKRNPMDKFNIGAATNIAFYRAITEQPVLL
jgi:hypothetical protein